MTLIENSSRAVGGCDKGYSSNIAGKDEVSSLGECAFSQCPENAIPTSHPDCIYRKGYEGELQWTGVGYEGTCRKAGLVAMAVTYNAGNDYLDRDAHALLYDALGQGHEGSDLVVVGLQEHRPQLDVHPRWEGVSSSDHASIAARLYVQFLATSAS